MQASEYLSVVTFMLTFLLSSKLFFLSATPTSQIYTLSLHDALPISVLDVLGDQPARREREDVRLQQRDLVVSGWPPCDLRSEEHTSELQSLRHLVCRLLLEKKNHGRCRY